MEGKKKNLVLIFALAALTVSVVYLAGVNYSLQREYDSLSEHFRLVTHSHAMIIDGQWTDNAGVDSNYVHYSGGLFNTGQQKAYNVTVIVLVHGLDNSLLKKEEILIGDLGAQHYQTFDVDVEYSGELSYVSAGTTWE